MKDINIKKIISFFRPGNLESDRSVLANVSRDWSLALVLLLGALILSALLSYSYFASSDSVTPTTLDTESPTLDEEGLLEVAERFEKREKEFNTLLSTPPQPIDPG